MNSSGLRTIERIAHLASEVSSDINALTEKYFSEIKDTIPNNSYYIVTNVTGIGEYTPSVFQTIDSAEAWLKECSVTNFIAGLTRNIEFEGIVISTDGKKDYFKYLSDKGLVDRFISDVINKWEHSDGDCHVGKFSSTISYTDGSFNNMQVYEITFNGNKPSLNPVKEK